MGTNRPICTIALYDEFVDWLFQNYLVWNRERLVELQEDGDVQVAFLRAKGYPEDTVIPVGAPLDTRII